ncbi:Elongator complex protein 1 [Globisporangium polare]
MRNLVSLRRQLWPLANDANVSAQQTYLCFALSAGENQAYFQRRDGRIDVATLEDDGARQPVKLLVDLREFIPSQGDDGDDELNSVNASRGWKWISYVAELDALACAHSNGTLAVVDVNARAAEEIGAMDGGICGIAWSSNQEMVAVVTGVGTLLVMNTQWEVLHETQLDAFLPSDLTRNQQNGVEIAVCWREDAQFLVVNVPVVVGGGGAGDKVMQKVMVFTGQLEFHALGRLEDGRAIPQLGAALDWCPNHSLITSSETRKEQLFVVFFERNGLRHGEFALPADYRAPGFRVKQVGWNIDSDVLAVALESTTSPDQQQHRSVVQLWTRNNYHWYLKQERHLHSEDKRLVHFAWDDEKANKLHLLTSSGSSSTVPVLLQEEFVWDVSRVERNVLSAVANTTKPIVVTGVIDGNKLLLTPLHQALVPPPFALHQVEFPAAINSVVFDSQSEVLAVLLANGDLVVAEQYLSSTEKTIVQQEQDSEGRAMITSLQWMRLTQTGDAKSLSLIGKSDWNDALVVASVKSLNGSNLLSVEYPPALEGVRRATEVVSQHGESPTAESSAPRVAVQIHEGTVYTLSPLDSEQEESVVTELSDRSPAFGHLLVIAIGPDVTDPSDHLVLGLQTTSKLYVNDKLVVPACSTFTYDPTASVLLFTTLGSQAQLRMVPLEGLKCQKLDVYESRTVERGAKLVAVVGDRANVVVQMPRGNLECMAPRLLVLALAIKQIEQLQYVAALEMCRKHRLDLNLLVDFDSQLFLSHFPRYLVREFLSAKPAQITSDRLCLFITNLHPVDVWETKYQPQVSPFITTQQQEHETENSDSESDKVNVVCQAIMRAIQELEQDEQCSEKTRSALLLPFLTAAVKQSPPQYTDALIKVQALLQSSSEGGLATAKRAIKHLILLTQVDVLYDEALGLYDIELVRFIATYSQRDPKEYVPFLDELSRISGNADLLKYTIDLHLNRHEKALVHVSALVLNTSEEEDAEKKREYEEAAVKVITQGALYDQAIALFPSSTASAAARAFQKRIVLLKGEHLEATIQHEAAAYVYLSEAAYPEAQAAFLAAGQWQMGLSLALKTKQPAADVQRLAYQVAEKLLSQKEVAEDVLPVARIYVEYCKDIDEAVALLVANKLYEEALRIAYLHKREDLIESDIESGVLQAFNDVLEEIATNSAAYVGHWKRLTTIREQKRLFKLHGIDGSRWQQDGNGADDTQSVYSGAPSAADSAYSNASMRSVGSHNSALSIGNFALKTLAQATSSHFYATQSNGQNGAGASTKPQKKVRLSRNERRNKIKKGSAEEERHILQQCVGHQPSATLKKNVKALLEMLVFFGHVHQAQTLQSAFGKFEQLVDVEHPLPQLEMDTIDAASGTVSKTAGATGSDGASPPAPLAWRLAALQSK